MTIESKPQNVYYSNGAKISSVAAPVKIATSNLFIDDNPIPVDDMIGLVFEDFGALELIDNYSMDILSPRNASNPITNANILRTYEDSRYTVPGTFGKFSANFAVNLKDYIPEEGNGPNGKTVYFDNETEKYYITGAQTNGTVYVTYNSIHNVVQGDTVNISGMTTAALNLVGVGVVDTSDISFTVQASTTIATATYNQSGYAYKVIKTKDDNGLNANIVIDVVGLKQSEQIEIEMISDSDLNFIYSEYNTFSGGGPI